MKLELLEDTDIESIPNGVYSVHSKENNKLLDVIEITKWYIKRLGSDNEYTPKQYLLFKAGERRGVILRFMLNRTF